MSDKIRFGIFGLGRGLALAPCIVDAGAELVAVCDVRPDALAAAQKQYPQAAAYDNFDAFLAHDMDAVLLANYFCDHASFAIRAMRAGKHVLSETISNITLAEGVALCRAKEETGMTYALLENYPFFKENLEMRRVYQGGSLGDLVYAEGEYSHPMSADDQNGLAPGEKHWRNWTPRTYYSTHALAPLMMMTGATPVRVSAIAAFQPSIAKGTALHTGDAAAVILCQTDTNAILRVIGWAGYAPHGNYYRLCCTKGGMETNHGSGDMRLVYNHWSRPDDATPDASEYPAQWPDAGLAGKAEKAGHGGGDFMVIYDFVKCLEEGRQPYFDVYRATTTASVAILAWRSVLNNNMTYDVPDFRREADRRKYEFDTISPYPEADGKVDIPCSSQPYAPTADDLRAAHEKWESMQAQQG